MNESVTSLSKISSTYTIFEKDQILTEQQLNSITSYLDPQNRLTRVNCFGVGIANGLNVSFVSGQVHLNAGLGITTDGDLVCEKQRMSFSGYRDYGLEAPKYAPLYRNANTMFDVWELVAVGTEADGRKPLSQFRNNVGKNLRDMTCVLLVENYVKDEDFCQVDDCENLGKDHLCNVKVLLLETASLNKLKHDFSDVRKARNQLNPIADHRVKMADLTGSVTALNNGFLLACRNMNAKLLSNLELSDWGQTLKDYAPKFNQNTPGSQYYYDFLSDLCAVWNELCCKTPSLVSLACPDFSAFPKHLILGSLSLSADKDKDRFSFYPSKIEEHNSEEEEFVFLIEKLDSMIRSFNIERLTRDRELIVTPSLRNPMSVGDGAIPFYYQAKGDKPIHEHWNYQLSRRGKAKYNYGFRANEYEALPPAISPLDSRIEQFPFFRVEGQVGKKVSTVVSNLEKQIAEQALPFTVRTAYVGANRARVVKKKGVRYNDLHRLHYLFRQDLSHQLGEVKMFSQAYTSNIKNAVTDSTIEEVSGSASFQTMSKDFDRKINRQADQARNSLALNYTAFTKTNSWRGNIAEAMESASGYKKQLGDITKTEFSTPFDGLIDNTKVNWLPWLDTLIEEKDKKEDDKLLFSTLLKDHPGLLHACGVPSGGTLVLLYDDTQTVVADCMSACHLPEPEVIEEPVEPVLPSPAIRKPAIINEGIFINPSREMFFDKKFLIEGARIDQKITNRVDVQEQLVNTFKDSFSIYSNSLTTAPTKNPRVDPKGLGIGSLEDNKIGVKNRTLEASGIEHDLFIETLKNPNLSAPQRNAAEKELKEREVLMAKEIERAAVVLSEDNISVKTGSPGGQALENISVNLARLERSPNGIQNRKKAINSIKRVSNRTSNQGLKVGLTGLIR